MQAQPRVRTLFKNKNNRTYKIKISRHLVLNDSTKAIEDLPQDILIGWLAHELGHVVDYIERSSFQMIGFGFKYVTSRAFLRRAERRADTYAIRNGFANELVKTKRYILEKENMPSDYKQRINRLYISPEEVRIIEKGFEDTF